MSEPGRGAAMHELVSRLFPLNRSITGDGVRATLAGVADVVPLEVHEVPSGEPVLDWVVPDEWNLRGGWIRDERGTAVVDAARSNLHVLGYSEPVSGWFTREELEPHLHALPDRPRLVPYRTSYYRRTWGFCLSQEQLDALRGERFEVSIDATLAPGSLTYGEAVVPGDEDGEVLISTHTCHPSLANDNLSGIAVAAHLAASLAARSQRRFTYRFVFVPGTIGSITWLARNEHVVPRIRHGLVLTGLGDAGPFTYKRSRRGGTDVDRAAEHVLAHVDPRAAVVDFSPYGYDERQYCSPGFDLPVGRLSRSPHGEYPEYHTSGDDLSFVHPAQLEHALTTVEAVIDVLEGDGRYRNLSPKGEPQLGRRGLYRSIGASMDAKAAEMALLWVLSLSDGTASLLDVAERSGLPFASIRSAADALLEADLLAPC